MRLREIADMDEIADATSVRRRIVGAEHVDLGALPGGGLDRDLQQMRGADGGKPDACLRIGARDIEVAQHDVVHAVRGGDIVQHDFGHQLRGAVRRQRPGRRVFGNRHLVRIAVDGGGRRKDEAVDAALHCGVEQAARRHGVVAVIGERIAHRIRHHHRAGEMNDALDAVRGDHALDEVLVRRRRR